MKVKILTGDESSLDTTITEARQEALGFLERAAALADRAAQLDDSVWAVFTAIPAKRLSLERDMAALRTELVAFDAKVIGRVGLYSVLSRDQSAADLTIQSVVRSTIGRYLDSASRDLNDATLRALTRATLWISIAVLAASLITVWVTMHPPVSSRGI